jgi:two-component system phosphate regulon sensor histidine kinase PhoR
MPPVWRRRKPGTAQGQPAALPQHGRPDGEGPSVLLDHAGEAMLLIHEERVRWTNPAARLLFPTLDSPVGRQVVEVVRDHRIEGLIARVRSSGVEQSAEVELPVSGRRLLLRGVPAGDSTIALLAQDLTRLRHLEKVRQEFVANLSHELRTPLAGLDLAAQTLSEQLPPDGDQRLFIDRIGQESQRLQAILSNLNQLAALDAEGVAAERQPFDAGQLVEELVDRFRGQAEAANLRLRGQGSDEGLEVLGDRGKTDQALQNIVDNALKFSPQGEVVVSARVAEGKVEIAVRDSGPGIPARDLPRIFERFYKVDRARGGHAGSGLGLSIARHLVELQGGTIVAESTPGTGTTIRVRLPRSPLTSP